MPPGPVKLVSLFPGKNWDSLNPCFSQLGLKRVMKQFLDTFFFGHSCLVFYELESGFAA